MFIDGVISHYRYVRDRIQTVNSKRIVRGFALAQDWPPQKYDPDAFYLITGADDPIGRQGFSVQTPIVAHTMQWVWICKGADISAGQIGPNRGTRFATHFAMKEEIKQAMAPYFCEKKSWAYDLSTEPPKFSGTSLDPVEYILWAPPSYSERMDKTSGLVYGTVSVRVIDMLDPITI